MAIDIRSAARRLYFSALPDSNPDNEDWARRKGNVVLRCNASSPRVGLPGHAVGASGAPPRIHQRELMSQWIDAAALDDIDDEDVKRFDHDGKT